MSNIRERLEYWARAARRDGIALYLAARDPRVSWLPKALAALAAAYALSPIDLIPDFIPVLGYVDDVILLPIAVWAIVRFIDPDIMAEHRASAIRIAERPVSALGAGLIVALWIAAAGFLICLLHPRSTG